MRDITYEAAFLRDAVLVGLIHEQLVVEWAADLIGSGIGPAGPLAEVLSVPVQLSPIREALRAFGTPSDPARISGALLTCAALDAARHQRDGASLLRVLSDIRRLVGCAKDVGAAIADYEARSSMAQAGLDAVPPDALELRRWLDDVREPAQFLVTSCDPEEAAAFAMALGETRAGAGQDRGGVTVVRAEPSGPGVSDASGQLGNPDVVTVALDESAWLAARELAAHAEIVRRLMTAASTIPYLRPHAVGSPL